MRTEGGADDHTDGEIHDVSAGDELLKFFSECHKTPLVGPYWNKQVMHLRKSGCRCARGKVASAHEVRHE